MFCISIYAFLIRNVRAGKGSSEYLFSKEHVTGAYFVHSIMKAENFKTHFISIWIDILYMWFFFLTLARSFMQRNPLHMLKPLAFTFLDLSCCTENSCWSSLCSVNHSWRRSWNSLIPSYKTTCKASSKFNTRVLRFCLIIALNILFLLVHDDLLICDMFLEL